MLSNTKHINSRAADVPIRPETDGTSVLRGPHIPLPAGDEAANRLAAPRTTLESISNVEQLEAELSEPTEGVIEALSRLDGDLIILGAGGKMGPSLARMARRAYDAADHPGSVVAVSRFTERGSQHALKAHGVDTIACDLLDPKQIDRLPQAANVVFMAGMKFGSTGREPLTWAINCHLPALICHKFRHSRIVAFSTGNVYGLTPVHLGGPDESDAPNPIGEYAMSCLGRERMFEYFSHTLDIPMAMLRLNYACELRYGVLVDLAEKVWADEPIDLTMGHVNIIWQADANAMALCSFDHVSMPPRVVNIAGPELSSIRQVCEQFGRLLNQQPRFMGEEAPDAVLNNGQLGHRLLGSPQRSVAEVIPAVAAWIQRGGVRLEKPTHYAIRDGKF